MHSVCAVCRRKQKTKKIKHHIWLVLLYCCGCCWCWNEKWKCEEKKRMKKTPERFCRDEKQYGKTTEHKSTPQNLKYVEIFRGEKLDWKESRTEKQIEARRFLNKRFGSFVRFSVGCCVFFRLFSSSRLPSHFAIDTYAVVVCTIVNGLNSIPWHSRTQHLEKIWIESEIFV